MSGNLRTSRTAHAQRLVRTCGEHFHVHLADHRPPCFSHHFEIHELVFELTRDDRLDRIDSTAAGEDAEPVDHFGSHGAECVFERGDSRRRPSNSIGLPTENCCRRTATRATSPPPAVTLSAMTCSSILLLNHSEGLRYRSLASFFAPPCLGEAPIDLTVRRRGRWSDCETCRTGPAKARLIQPNTRNHVSNDLVGATRQGGRYQV